MAEPMLGEIKIVPYVFAPRDFANCFGQLLPISQNPGLFSIIGTTYGGDGRVSMGVPNFTGRTAMHWGTAPGLSPIILGQKIGERMVLLDETSIPEHTHEVYAALAVADSNNPLNKYLGNADAVNGSSVNIYDSKAQTQNFVHMSSSALKVAGAGQRHDNMQPYQVFRYIISLNGIYPSRN